MTLTVREFRAADSEAVSDVVRVVLPYLVTTPEKVAWEVANAPAARRYRVFVAEFDGRVVGTARAGLILDSAQPGQATVNVNVLPEHRGRGVGGALLAAAENHVQASGAVSAHSWVLDDAESRGFVERHGYQRGRSSKFQRLDLAVAALPPLEIPPGVELRAASDFAGDPRPLYELDTEAARDEPSAVELDAMPYQDWLAMYWDRPDLDRDLTTVAVVDGVAAAFSGAQTDGRTRYWSAMTGTLRAYRGRGLAKLAKNQSLHRAKAAGYTEALTGNDDENGPMLAINRWFGYQPSATEWVYKRDL
ncbi:MAG: GNAT family N-acetyltransferase [Micromonosporaceae bacterium]|nr:GNAT family N-acetyltransferase [Micromonosporaceae bacterium]